MGTLATKEREWLTNSVGLHFQQARKAAQWGLHVGALGPPLHQGRCAGGTLLVIGMFQMKLETQG